MTVDISSIPNHVILQCYVCSILIGPEWCRMNHMILVWSLVDDNRLIPYLRISGFYGAVRLGFCHLDHHFITALVERWRPETHIFMLPHGECTIIRQDMRLIFGLSIDSNAIFGSIGQSWQLLCQDLLGMILNRDVMKGNSLELTWLRDNFDHISYYADDITIQRHARAFILRLISGSLFVDKSAHLANLMFLPLLANLNRISQYSWGAACLAWLYK